MMVAWAQPIAQNKGGHTERVEIVRHLAAFVIAGEVGVAATRTNDDGGCICRNRAWQKYRDGRDVAILRSESPGSPTGPQRNDLAVLYRQWLLLGPGIRYQRENDQNSCDQNPEHHEAPPRTESISQTGGIH